MTAHLPDVRGGAGLDFSRIKRRWRWVGVGEIPDSH
jgi:hypothetical protein